MNEHHRGDRETRQSLYLTGSHPCSYLTGLSARTLFVDPLATIDGPVYEWLLGIGFRRSGSHVYRPACKPCLRCIPVRIPVERFVRNRSQRRNARLNADVTLTTGPAVFDPEQHGVYEAYIRGRHPGGSMAEATDAQSYKDFLIRPWGGETLLLEMRLGERLLGVAVTDRLPGALSAVYTYFDPELSERAPGNYAVLCQIDLAHQLGMKYLYLGYWIDECRKMSYKRGYRPIQAFIAGCWREYARGEPIGWKT